MVDGIGILNKEIEKDKYTIAISSKTGVNIDEHFGHSSEFYIYTYGKDGIRFIEKRVIDKYCTGVEECEEHHDKISKILEVIEDCNIVLTMRVGIEPIQRLEEKGIKVIQMYETINEGINRVIKGLITS